MDSAPTTWPDKQLLSGDQARGCPLAGASLRMGAAAPINRPKMPSLLDFSADHWIDTATFSLAGGMALHLALFRGRFGLIFGGTAIFILAIYLLDRSRHLWLGSVAPSVIALAALSIVLTGYWLDYREKRVSRATSGMVTRD